MKELLAEAIHKRDMEWLGFIISHLDDAHIARWRQQIYIPYQSLAEDDRQDSRKIAQEYLSMVADTVRKLTNYQKGPGWYGFENCREAVINCLLGMKGDKE